MPGHFCFTFTPGEKNPVESTAKGSGDKTLEGGLDEKVEKLGDKTDDEALEWVFTEDLEGILVLLLEEKWCNSSSTQLVSCGDPQGSTLAPLLFLTYINNFHKAFSETFVHIFVDDTNMLLAGKNVDHIESL